MATKKTKAFVPYGKKPVSAEYGEMKYGVHESGVAYKWPANVLDITCLICQERTGRPLEVCNGEVTVTFPVCGSCRDKMMQFDELPDELNDLMLERMIERRIIDAQVDNDKKATKAVKVKSGTEKLDPA